MSVYMEHRIKETTKRKRLFVSERLTSDYDSEEPPRCVAAAVPRCGGWRRKLCSVSARASFVTENAECERKKKQNKTKRNNKQKGREKGIERAKLFRQSMSILSAQPDLKLGYLSNDRQ